MKVFFKNHWSGILSLIAIVISIVSWLDARESNRIALEANRIAQEANSFTQEANEIAREANRLIIASGESKIVAYMGMPGTAIYMRSCKFDDGSFGLTSLAGFDVSLTNVGVRGAELHQIELTDKNRYWKNIKVFVDDQELVLPVKFESGYRSTWRIAADSIMRFNSEEEAVQTFEELFGANTTLKLLLKFDDGTHVEWEIAGWTSTMPLSVHNFRADCNI